MTEITELLELAKRCEDRALYNTSGDPMRLLKDAAGLMRRHAMGMREIAKSPPSRQENDDVFPGFRGNNDGG